MATEIAKAEFEKAFTDFNCQDVQSIANAIIHWVETNTNPYIPPIILGSLKVKRTDIDKAMMIVCNRLGDDVVTKWEDQIND